MSAIQYLVYPHARALIENDWSHFFARAIRSVASTNLIDQLCESESIVEIQTPSQIVSTLIMTSTTTATSIITKTSFLLPQTAPLIRDQSIFSDFPGFSMHPLTFSLILVALFTFLSLSLFSACMYRVRSNRKAVNAIRAVLAIATAEVQQNKADRNLIQDSTTLKTDNEVLLDNASEKGAQAKEEPIAEKQALAARLTASTRECEELRRQMTKIAIEKKDLISDCAVSQHILTLKLATAEDAVYKLTKENTSLSLAHTHEAEALRSYDASQQILTTKLAGAEKEIVHVKEKTAALLLQHEREIKAIKAESSQEAASSIAGFEDEKAVLVSQHAISVESLNQKVTDAMANITRLQTEQKALISQHKEIYGRLEKELDDATTEIDRQKAEIAQQVDQVSDADFEVEELKIDMRDLKEEKEALVAQYDASQKSLVEQIGTAFTEVARLNAEKDAMVSKHIASQQRLNEKLVASQSEAQQLGDDIIRLRFDALTRTRDQGQITKDLEEAIKEKEQLRQSLDGSIAREKVLMKSATAKDSEIASLQATNRVLNDDAASLTKARRDHKYEKRNIDAKFSQLRTSNASMKQQLDEKDLALEASRKETRDEKSALAITQMNYNFVSKRYEEEKRDNERLRAEAIDVTTLTLIQLAKDLGVSSPHFELSVNPKKKVLTAKAVDTRLRSVKKMLNKAAERFTLPVNDKKPRRHSISGGETRLQVGETMPERSSHLMTPLENDYINSKMATTTAPSAPADLPDFQRVKSSFKVGRLPYSSEDIEFLMHDTTTTTTLFLLETFATQVSDISLELRGASSALWAKKTQYDVAAFFHHRVKAMEKKAVASQGAAIEALTLKMDNRLICVYNQLNKYRLSNDAESTVLDSVLNGQQGIRSIISKASKN